MTIKTTHVIFDDALISSLKMESNKIKDVSCKTIDTRIK